MNEQIRKLNREIEKEIGWGYPENARFEHIESGNLTAERKNGQITVYYKTPLHIARAALIFKARGGADFCETEAPYLEDMCFMADCSRNAVLNLQAAKKLIRVLALLGYNQLMLYTEDTYEVENEPCFGYMRGAFKAAEIRELDEYAKIFGIELFPCIQTLAHLNQIVRYKEYETHFDCNDILLAGDERVYELIENMFKTLAKTYTSRRVHIGMDEAGMLGRGSYLNLHGYRSKFDIFTEHLSRVAAIAAKYGFSALMWSDMFWKIAEEEKTETDKNGNAVIPESVKRKIPENVSLVHWDYGWHDTPAYRRRFAMHRGMKNPVWYSGSSYKCVGFLPFNGLNKREFDVAFEAMKAEKITHGINCGWGDDGAECPLFSVLPSMAYYAYKSYGKAGEEYERDFMALTGYTRQEFLAIEAPNTRCGEYEDDYCNPTKIALYNDLFCPQFDSDLSAGDLAGMKKARLALKKILKTHAEDEYTYLFKFSLALCEAAILKYDLGIKIRAAYQKGEKDALFALVKRLSRTISATRKFLNEMRNYWQTENKPFGADVQEYRLGGLIERLSSCRTRLLKYLAGEICKIDELEETPLKDMFSGRVNKERFHYNSFLLTASVNKF